MPTPMNKYIFLYTQKTHKYKSNTCMRVRDYYKLFWTHTAHTSGYEKSHIFFGEHQKIRSILTPRSITIAHALTLAHFHNFISATHQSMCVWVRARGYGTMFCLYFVRSFIRTFQTKPMTSKDPPAQQRFRWMKRVSHGVNGEKKMSEWATRRVVNESQLRSLKHSV